MPERLKRLIFEPPEHMIREWEDVEPPFVYCEEPTLAELEFKGVPTEEWPYYVGYMKRMLELYKQYTGDTLQLEKDSLIAEYVLRGYDKEVLQQVQEVAENCSEEIYLSCPMVLLCIEPEWTTYTALWTVNDWENQNSATLHWVLRYNGNIIIIWDQINDRVLLVNLTTGALIASLAVQNWGNIDYYPYTGSFKRYMAFVDVAAGVRIYKDGVLLQTVCADWAGDSLQVAMSQDGKYLLAYNFNPSPNQWRLFEAS